MIVVPKPTDYIRPGGRVLSRGVSYPCRPCSGTGRIYRTRLRKLRRTKGVQTYHSNETCQKCGGRGRIGTAT